MNPFEDLAKILIFMGVIICILGIFLLVGSKIPLLGKLPGDIVIRKGNFTFYFPLATCILLSILLTLILSVIFRR